MQEPTSLFGAPRPLCEFSALPVCHTRADGRPSSRSDDEAEGSIFDEADAGTPSLLKNEGAGSGGELFPADSAGSIFADDTEEATGEAETDVFGIVRPMKEPSEPTASEELAGGAPTDQGEASSAGPGGSAGEEQAGVSPGEAPSEAKPAPAAPNEVPSEAAPALPKLERQKSQLVQERFLQRVAKFKAVLTAEEIDLEELRALAQTGGGGSCVSGMYGS